jgi:4-hydroxy-tetrahydrodipicolinate synthase
MQRWHGVISSVTTKFTSTDQLDVTEIERCLALQSEAGVRGFVVTDSLGEGPSLDLLEKIEVMKAALRVAARKLPVLLTICSPSTREACLLAEASAKYGAEGLMVACANAYKPDPVEVEHHYRAIARAGGLPIMISNDPSASGVDITPELLAKLADEPLFRAIKEASGDTRRITRIINLTGNRYDLFAGVDSLAFESLVMGVSGWIVGLANAFPKEMVAIWRYAATGHVDEARRIYRWFQPLLDLNLPPKHVQNVKLVERMVAGSNDRCRPPRQPLRGEERLNIERLVRYALASRASILLHPPAAE